MCKDSTSGSRLAPKALRVVAESLRGSLCEGCGHIGE